MFVTSTNTVGVSQRVVATLVACATVLASIGVYHNAQAADLSDISNLLTDSAPSQVSDHTITFTVPAGPVGDGVAAGETIVVEFPAGFAMGTVDFNDIDLVVNSVEQTLAAAPSGATWGAVVSGQTLTFTSGTGVVNAGETVVIEVGTNADSGTNQVTNPTVGSYEFLVTAGDIDSGRTRVAIVDNVLVTAVVDTVFNFTITGVATSTSINGETTTGSTSPDRIDFGQLVADTEEVLGQQLAVETNAANGFVVTVEQSQDLQSGGGGVIDSFQDGSYLDTPGAWALPGDNIADDTTWGHWGLTTEDGNLHGAGVAFSGVDQFIAASTSPRAIFAHNGPSDGSTTGAGTAADDDVGLTEVAYKIEITPLQEAGNDYQTTLTYIATPTF